MAQFSFQKSSLYTTHMGSARQKQQALHMEEHKKYRACSEPLQPISEEQVHRFCARREFVTICHTNGCKPLAIEAASVK